MNVCVRVCAFGCSMLGAQDLVRASVQSASAVFVFANKFASNPDTEDSHTIMRAFSIKRWVAS